MEAKDLLELLLERHLTIASMESLTGGLFAAFFTAIPGASQAFKGALVTYCDEAKEKFGVRKETIDNYGAISPECAKEMCLAASSLLKSDIAVSFTGNAGPSADEGKPVGLVYVGIQILDTYYGYRLDLTGERAKIRRSLVDFAFQTIYEKVSASPSISGRSSQ